MLRGSRSQSGPIMDAVRQFVWKIKRRSSGTSAACDPVRKRSRYASSMQFPAGIIYGDIPLPPLPPRTFSVVDPRGIEITPRCFL